MFFGLFISFIKVLGMQSVNQFGFYVIKSFGVRIYSHSNGSREEVEFRKCILNGELDSLNEAVSVLFSDSIKPNYTIGNSVDYVKHYVIYRNSKVVALFEKFDDSNIVMQNDILSLYSSYNKIPELAIPDFIDNELNDYIKLVFNEGSVNSFCRNIIDGSRTNLVLLANLEGDALVMRAKVQLGIQSDALKCLSDLSLRLSILNELMGDTSAINEVSQLISDLEINQKTKAV